MTSARILDDLPAIGEAQLEAARRGDLEQVARLERERRELVADLRSEELAQLAEQDPEGFQRAVNAVQGHDRRLKELFRAKLQQRGRDLARINERRKAEQAYRRI